MFGKFRILFILLLLTSLHYAQTPLATVGGTPILKEDFEERYEMSPQMGKPKDSVQIASRRMKFLYGMISEKLWAAEAQTLGLNATPAIETATKVVTKLYLRDALYKREIKDKISITKDELLAGLSRYRTKVFVNYLFSPDSAEIYDLYHLIQKGIAFDSILAESPEAVEQELPVEVNYGQMDQMIEDSLFTASLQYSVAPILTPDGWYIFHIKDVQRTFPSDIGNLEDEYKAVEKIIRARKEAERFADYYISFLAPQAVTADAKLLRQLASAIYNQIKNKPIEQLKKKQTGVTLDAKDVLVVQKELGEQLLQQVFLNFETDPISLSDFFLQTAFDGFSVPTPDPEVIYKELNRLSRKFIEGELFSREAVKANLQYLPDVRRGIEMWKENYLFQLLRQNVLNDVPVAEEEIQQFYDAYYKTTSYPAQVNIVEIFNQALDTIQVVANLLNSGADFTELAAKYNRRTWTLKSNGEYGYFPVFLHGEIGSIASMMEIGDVYGPFKTDSGYAVIKLIGKKSERIENPAKSLNDVRDDIRRALSFQKGKALLNQKTAEFAVKYGISIDSQVFNSIQATEMSTMVIRYFGFGGSMTAVPMLAPDFQWMEEYFRLVNQMP